MAVTDQHDLTTVNTLDAIPDDIFSKANYTFAASSPQNSSKFNPFTPRHRAEMSFEKPTNILRNEMMQLTASSGESSSSRSNKPMKKSAVESLDPRLQRGALTLLSSSTKKDTKKRSEMLSSVPSITPMSEEDMLDILRKAVNYTESQNIVSDTAVSTREWMRSIIKSTPSQSPQQNSHHHHPRSKSNPAPDRSLLPPTI